MSINLTDEIEVKTKKGKLGAAKQIFLEGDTKNVEKEIQDINSRHNTLNTKHESLSRTVQGIAATSGASTANNVTYNNDSSGLNAENAQDAIDEVSSIAHFAKIGGIVNISTNYNSINIAEVLTLEQAITKVPTSDRTLGFVGTFLTSDGWSTYQFNGNSLTEWLDISKWLNTYAFALDEKPTAGSDNLVKSGGVADRFYELEKFLLVFVGRNNEGYDIPINNLIPGHKYRVFIPSKWDISGITISYVGWQMFNLYKKKEEQKNELKVFKGTDDFNAQWCEFDAEEGYEYYIYARATEGVIVKFELVDITLQKTLSDNLLILYSPEHSIIYEKQAEGHGMENLSSTNMQVSLKAGTKYYMNIKCSNPTFTGKTETSAMIQLTGIYGNPTILNISKSFAGTEIDKTIEYVPDTDISVFLYDRIQTTDKVYLSISRENVVNKETLKRLSSVEGNVETQKTKTDNLESRLNNLEFVGQGKVIVVKTIPTIKNRTYKLLVANPDWNKEGCYPGYDGAELISCHAKDINGIDLGLPKFVASINSTGAEAIKSEYIFKTDTLGAEYYTIELRASIGEKVRFSLLDITDEEDSIITRNKEQFERIKSMGILPYDIRTQIPPLVFLHISDTHAPIGTANQVTNSMIAFNALLPKNGGRAKFLLHTGDIRYDEYADDYTFFENALKLAEGTVFLVPGNHDCGNTTNSLTAGTDEQIYHQMIEPMLPSWNLVTTHSGTPHPEGKNYYFKDFEDEKIRMICLYEFETDFALEEDGVTLVNPRPQRAFRQAQIDWLINSLQTVPEDFGVIVVKHQPENKIGNTDTVFNSTIRRGAVHMNTAVSSSMIAEIIDAYMNKTAINKSWTQNHNMQSSLTANVNFANANGEFICYVSGHIHRDHTCFLEDFPNQLELNIGANNTGYNTGQDIKMTVGNKSQDIINVYSIDRNQGEIHIARIGGDYACTGQVRQFSTIKYRNVNTL